MSASRQSRAPSRDPDRLPIFSRVGQRRRRFSGIAILALTSAALMALALVLAGAL